MLKKYLWVVALGLALCGIQASAQDKVTVYYPDGTVRIEDARLFAAGRPETEQLHLLSR